MYQRTDVTGARVLQITAILTNVLDTFICLLIYIVYFVQMYINMFTKSHADFNASWGSHKMRLRMQFCTILLKFLIFL